MIPKCNFCQRRSIRCHAAGLVDGECQTHDLSDRWMRLGFIEAIRMLFAR